MGLIVNGKFNKDTLRHVFITTQIQLVVIYDTSLFYENIKDGTKGIVAFGKIAAGYFLYILPVGFIGYLFLFVYSTVFVCEAMKAPFLLNNNFKPLVNMTELYLMRQQLCEEIPSHYDKNVNVTKCNGSTE